MHSPSWTNPRQRPLPGVSPSFVGRSPNPSVEPAAKGCHVSYVDWDFEDGGDSTPIAPRLPAWTWDETVLAYDLYLREYAKPLRYPDGEHEVVSALSNLLRSLPLHPVETRGQQRFRNPNGVARKMQNLIWDTGHEQGSPNGSAIDVRVVQD